MKSYAKKLLAFSLALVLVLSAAGLPAMAAGGPESTGLYAAEGAQVPPESEEGEPVEPDAPVGGAPNGGSALLPNVIGEPTPISTPEEFLALSGQSGSYVLKADIDFGGEEITPISNFTGSLDGAGHTISGFVVSASGTVGLFGMLSKGYIGNLTLEKYTLKNAQCGVLAGYISQSGGESLTIENITLGDGANNPNGTYIGGIASLVYQKGPDCKLVVDGVKLAGDNVAASGSASYAGGVFAYVLQEAESAGSTVEISNVLITDKSSDTSYPLEANTAGGAIGWMKTEANASVRISNVVVDDSVTLKTQSYTGAAIGYMNGSAGEITLDNIVMEGRITGSYSGNFVGGTSFNGKLSITNSLGSFAAQGTSYSGGAIGYAKAGDISISGTAFVANAGAYEIPGLISAGSTATAAETNCARLVMPRRGGFVNSYYTVRTEPIGGEALAERLSIAYLPSAVDPDAYIADENGWKFTETGLYAISFEVYRDRGTAQETKMLAGGCNFDVSEELDSGDGAYHIHGEKYSKTVDGETVYGYTFTIPDSSEVEGADGRIVIEGDEFMSLLRDDLANNNPDGKSSNTNCAYWEEHADGILKFVNESGQAYVVTGWEFDTLNDEYNNGAGPDYGEGEGSTAANTSRPQGYSATEAYGFDGVRIPYNLTVNRAITPMLSGSAEDLGYDSVLYKDLMAENYAAKLLEYYKTNCADPSHSCKSAQSVAELDESHLREIFGGTAADVQTIRAFDGDKLYGPGNPMPQAQMDALAGYEMFKTYGWVHHATPWDVYTCDNYWLLESDPELVKLAYDRFYQSVLMFTLDNENNQILPDYKSYIGNKHTPILDPSADGYAGNPDNNYWADYMDESSEEAEWMNEYGFGSMVFDAEGKNVYEFENVAMRIRGENYTDGYAYKSTPEFNFNDSEMGNWPGLLTFRIYLQPADYGKTVTLTPVDITCYTGGDSMSGDSFPAVRYEIEAPEGVDVEELIFSVSGSDGSGTAIPAGDYYIIPALTNTFTLRSSEAQDDGEAGIYDIGVENAGELTASAAGTNYKVSVKEGGRLTVRYVSAPEQVLDETKVITSPVVTGEGQVSTASGMAAAVIPAGASFYTNGRSKGLGVVGAAASGGAEIALLFDDILNLQEAVGEGEDAAALLIARAGAAQSGVTFEPGRYQFKYLDLVNADDGNAWVSTDRDITVFWPYPEAVKGSYSDYTFSVVHFEGLHREAYAADSNGVIDQIASAPVEVLDASATEKGVKFTLPANAETGSFSPFALVWEPVEDGGGTTPGIYYTLHYESNGGTEYPDERYAPNTVVALDKVPMREGYTFTGWYADEGLTQRISSVTMTSDKTVYAGWRKTPVPGMLNGDDHFAYVIGYEDGTVKPLNNITRSEAAAIFFRLLDPEVREEYLTDENPFEDVLEEAWYNKAVSTLNALNIFRGKTDTEFDGSAYITRAEFAAVCARFDTSLTAGSSSFTDIAGHWAEEEIKRAASLGWIMGYNDGSFRPDQPITRAEAMTLINRVLNRIPEDESDLLPGMNEWPDNRPEDWYYLAVQEATNTHEYVHKGEIYETWIRLLEDPDWDQYQ